jgi:hypothetical protein
MVCVALTTTHDDEALAEAERVVDDLRDFRAEQAAEMLS